MRTLVITALVAAPALALAEPPAYIALGATTDDKLLFAGSLEIGDEVTPHLALHARGVTGEYLSLFGQGFGDVEVTQALSVHF